METEIITARELAIHATEIKHLQDDIDKIVADMDQIKKTLSDIQNTLATAKGGWKTLVFVGSIAAAVAGAIGGVITWFLGGYRG
jgi:prefoldin subunit 5